MSDSNQTVDPMLLFLIRVFEQGFYTGLKQDNNISAEEKLYVLSEALDLFLEDFKNTLVETVTSNVEEEELDIKYEDSNN